jgi:3-phytase
LFAVLPVVAVPAAAQLPMYELSETFWTPFDAADGVSGLASWKGPGGEHWLFAAGSKADRLLLFDAATGERKLYVGQTGNALGQMSKPVAFATTADLLFVVEAGNRRIQVLGLPEFTLLGTFGETQLKQPVSVVVTPMTDGSLQALVLDVATASPGQPTAEELASRVQRFTLVREGYTIRTSYLGSGAPTSGPGALLAPLAAAWDYAQNRLLVLDERGDAPVLVALDAAGQFQEAISLAGAGEPRSLGFLPCGNGGYWLLGEEASQRSQVRVLDAATFAPRGVFRSRTATNAVGLAALTSTPAQPGGAVYLGNNGQGAVAFDWAEVSKVLNLPACAPRG